MNRLLGFVRGTMVLLALAVAFSSSSYAQDTAGGRGRPLITGKVDESQVVKLSGNTRPEANVANDRGAVADDLPMAHMQLQLRRSPEQERALRQRIDQLHDPASPQFHQWLSPQQFGAQFGLAESDLQTITGWLQQHGFTVNSIAPSTTVIDFSGTAGQVRSAFHTEIHNLQVNGVSHIANMSDPQIPAALAPAVIGIVSLHDFRPKPQLVPKANYTAASGTYPVVPADLATIYNFNPLFNASITGTGQTIYLIEDTNLYTNNDWTTFRSTFGLSGYTGASLSTIHPAPPSGSNNCSNPGTTGDDDEAILDAEWASAAAPDATIVVASCENTNTIGVLIAIENLVNGPSPPSIISMSYGGCEAVNGAVANAALNSIYQQGVAEGISIFVASGDGNASLCSFDPPYAMYAVYGIGVNAFASTPYNVAVGGTDFGDTYLGTNSTYWNATNTSTYGSAKSYIPEIPWNDSCASQLITNYYSGGETTWYFCNTDTGQVYWGVVGGSGGPSGCATGTPSTSGVVSGSCAGYAKPSWQNGVVGIPNDGVRDLPDVSLFAANGVWGHYYIFCWSDTNNGGIPCTGAPSGWSDAGGTSFASPIMAGIQALVNQHVGSAQGNPNYNYYTLAAIEYGTSGSSTCNSSNGGGGLCIFNNVTLGDNDVVCAGDYSTVAYNCYSPSLNFGALSTSNNSYAPAYQTTTGWNFPTGIGTVNAYNLVMNWTELAVSVSGRGTVTSKPSGISCPRKCRANFTPGTKVYLTAKPTGSGGLQLSPPGNLGQQQQSKSSCRPLLLHPNTCTVIMNAAEEVSVTFK